MAMKSLQEMKSKFKQDQRAISHRLAEDLYMRAHIVVDHKANKLAQL